MGHWLFSSPLTNLRPIPKSICPSPLMTWPSLSKVFPQNHRFAPSSFLPSLSLYLRRFMIPIGNGHRLNHNHTLMLGWYKNLLRTLSLESYRCIIHVAKRLKKIGSMISSLMSGDYRSFFKCSSTIHLLIDFILEIISYT